jgi:hypothetical protein
MKTLLILTGPQGSGNHLWSKIFALHPRVQGWRALLTDYWIGHDEEPWAHYWQNPQDLRNAPWGSSDWHVTSISVPYMNNGIATVPDFKGFVTGVQNLGHRVKFAVLGRDKNILQYQETRVRGGVTLDQAVAEYSKFAQPTFLSYELLHLYGAQYLQKIERELEFPIDWANPQLTEILKEDTNSKYFQAVGEQPTDKLAKHASRKKK